jgi:hypothetical protein
MPDWAGLASIKRKRAPEPSELSSVQDYNPGPPDHEAELVTAHQHYSYEFTLQVSVCFEVQSGEQLMIPHFYDIIPRHLTIGSWRFKAT